MIITSNPTHSSFSRVSDVLNGEALSDTLGKLDSAPRAQGPPHIRGDPSFAGGELRAALRKAQDQVLPDLIIGSLKVELLVIHDNFEQ